MSQTYERPCEQFKKNLKSRVKDGNLPPESFVSAALQEEGPCPNKSEALEAIPKLGQVENQELMDEGGSAKPAGVDNFFDELISEGWDLSLVSALLDAQEMEDKDNTVRALEGKDAGNDVDDECKVPEQECQVNKEDPDAQDDEVAATGGNEEMVDEDMLIIVC